MRAHTHAYSMSVRGPHVCQSFIQTQLQLLHAAIITRWTQGKHIKSAFSLLHCTPSCETESSSGEKKIRRENERDILKKYKLSLN